MSPVLDIPLRIAAGWLASCLFTLLVCSFRKKSGRPSEERTVYYVGLRDGKYRWKGTAG